MSEQKRLPIFSERFNQLRGNRSQEEFALFLELSRPTIGFYENGSRLPDAFVLHQIAEKCEISADWLLGLSNARSTDADIKSLVRKIGISENSIQIMSIIKATDDAAANRDKLEFSDTIDLLISSEPTLHIIPYISRYLNLPLLQKKAQYVLTNSGEIMENKGEYTADWFMDIDGDHFEQAILLKIQQELVKLRIRVLELRGDCADDTPLVD